jgi:hypothetical protein
MAATYKAEESYYYKRDLKDKGKAIVRGAAIVQRY